MSCFITGHTEKDIFSRKTKKSTRSAKPRGRLKEKSTKGRGSEKVAEEEQYDGIGGKDTSLFLFRALGKILYCKRKSVFVLKP